MREFKLEVAQNEPAGRIDAWLAKRVPDLSRSRIQVLIDSGDITVDGRTVSRDLKTSAGMTVRVVVPDTPGLGLVPEKIPLEILYEDKDLVVVNKRPGLVVHPAAGHGSGTLVNALLHHCRTLPGAAAGLRPGIVHRLDKDTSGVIVAAKSDTAMASLSSQFKNRTVAKEYMAVVWGRLDPPRGRIDTKIARSTRDRKKMAVHRISGRQAVSRYETVEALRGMTLVRVIPETGRTHQIRLHLAHLGHPVVGDADYGGKRRLKPPFKADRQMLHAARLAFDHPVTSKRLEFAAPMPDDMRLLVDTAREHGGS